MRQLRVLRNLNEYREIMSISGGNISTKDTRTTLHGNNQCRTNKEGEICMCVRECVWSVCMLSVKCMLRVCVCMCL